MKTRAEANQATKQGAPERLQNEIDSIMLLLAAFVDGAIDEGRYSVSFSHPNPISVQAVKAVRDQLEALGYTVKADTQSISLSWADDV